MIDAPFFQAGLAGYSDAAMRLVARRHGAPYAITEAMTRYASTPKDVRATFSAEAARANIQLAMLLLDRGQVAAAEQVTHRLGRHEVAIRHDEQLRRDAAISGRSAARGRGTPRCRTRPS